METKVQILLSVMNLEEETEYNELQKKNKIKGNVTAVNQLTKQSDRLVIEKQGKNLYSYFECGVSNSRNRLLEKATGEICAFADDDTIYEEEYETIIEEAYHKNPKADGIIFLVENQNKEREKIKKIGNKKISRLDVMRVRSPEITLKKETIDKIKKENMQFDTHFGPGGVFHKGEETIFIADLRKKGFQIYSTNKKIATVTDEKSTWFTGYHTQFLYDQGAIFSRIEPKLYPLLILQYIIRKYPLYKEKVTIKQAYKALKAGAKKWKEIEREKNAKKDKCHSTHL